MTILNEAGPSDVLSPLHAVNGLAQRLPGALLVVVGTRAEAHIVHSLPAAPAPDFPRTAGSARVAFVVLEPAEAPQPGRMATRVIEAAAGLRGTGFVLLVVGRSAELLGVDADFEARLVQRRLDLPVEVVNPDAPYEDPGTLSTDLEDRALAALVSVCPKRRTSELLETASPAKRPRRFSGFLGRGSDEVRVSRTRPVALLGGLASPGNTGELTSDLERVGALRFSRKAQQPLAFIGQGVAILFGESFELLDHERHLQQELNGKADRQIRLLGQKHTDEQVATISREIDRLTIDYEQ